MIVEVYIDVLFLENLVINYLLLLLTSKFLRGRVSDARLLLGAAIGALYVLLLTVFPVSKAYYSIPAKIALSIVIVAAAFKAETIKEFLRYIAVFYICTFMFAGAALAFFYFNPDGGIVRNGIVYVAWDSKLMLLLLSTLAVGISLKTVFEFIKYRLTKEDIILPLIVAFESKTAELLALVDTGNSLHDPLTDVPVVIVELDSLKKILPEAVQTVVLKFNGSNLGELAELISSTDWMQKFRAIPFSSLGAANGMMIGLRPDYISVGEGERKRDVKDVVIGICAQKLSKGAGYNALLGLEFV